MAIINEFIRTPSIINNVIVNPSRTPQVLNAGIRLIDYSDTIQISLSTQLDRVFWLSNHISICKSNRNVMSFDFSGCLMAKYNTSNGYYVAHIHCDSQLSNDCRSDFVGLLSINQVRSNDLLLFRPLCNSYLYIPEDFRNIRSVAGIITQNNRCYSMVLEYNTTNARYDLVSVYEHITHPHNRDIIYEALMNFRINLCICNPHQRVFERESRRLIDIIDENTLIYRWF